MDKIRKDWAVMIALAAVSLLVVLNFSAILTWISEFIGMMFPLILGMILAFVLNVPMKRIEQVLEKINFPQKLRRSVAILSIIVILLLIISLLIWIIAPMIAKTVSQLGDSVNHLLFVVADFVQHSKLMQSSGSESDYRLTKSKQYRIVCHYIPWRIYNEYFRALLKCVLCNCGDFLHD